MASRCFLVFSLLAINNAVCSPLTDGLSFLYSRQAPSGGGAQPCRMNFTTDVWTRCDDLLAQFDLTLEEFMLANPSIGEACDGFKPGETYCVAPYIDVAVNATEDGTCGREIDFSKTCIGSDFGDCCGADGKCGSGEKFCGIGNCQEGACLGGGPWSTDGRCGRSVNYVPCPPKFGLCCSKDGTCGNDTVSCGAGCQYGDCSGTETTTWASAKPSVT
ncbi:hypothetical protein NW754_005948 [Fusarium falciforme]|nr:hypothetical protein NW754_005948 [Fusarium falciforme]